MVKIAGPLFSLGASGAVANTIVFSSWKGRPYVRERVVPSNPRTATQVAVRAMLRFLAQQWQFISGSYKDTWRQLAAQTNISPFNAYCAHNMKDWRQSLYPGQQYPVTRVSASPGQPTIATTPGYRQCTVKVTAGTPAPTWGYSIHRSTDSGFTADLSNCIAVITTAQGTLGYVDSNIAPGTYYYIAVPFNNDGKKGTASAATEGSAD